MNTFCTVHIVDRPKKVDILKGWVARRQTFTVIAYAILICFQVLNQNNVTCVDNISVQRVIWHDTRSSSTERVHCTAVGCVITPPYRGVTWKYTWNGTQVKDYIKMLYTVNQENLACKKICIYREKLILSLEIDQIAKFWCSQIKLIYSNGGGGRVFVKCCEIMTWLQRDDIKLSGRLNQFKIKIWPVLHQTLLYRFHPLLF